MDVESLLQIDRISGEVPPGCGQVGVGPVELLLLAQPLSLERKVRVRIGPRVTPTAKQPRPAGDEICRNGKNEVERVVAAMSGERLGSGDLAGCYR